MSTEKKKVRPANTRKAKPDKSRKKKDGLGKRSARWFREMKSELKKVVWPTRKQLVNNSVIVFVVMIISGVVIYAFDQVALLVVQTLISLG
ncbi:MAG: preprotein translocase subunit SecE [Clostridiales bacterium]|jgi:preprotein translocase subunit SecE|nr:preprotein translocase subunit SecE [Clostridiales bacterium]